MNETIRLSCRQALPHAASYSTCIASFPEYEALKDFNCIEQLHINYAADILQSQFSKYLVNAYNEGSSITNDGDDFPFLSSVALPRGIKSTFNTIFQKRNGLFPILEKFSSINSHHHRGDGFDLMLLLRSEHGGERLLDDGFYVRHYHGVVKYNVSNFVVKSTNHFADEFRKVVNSKSSSDFVLEIFGCQQQHQSGRRNSFNDVQSHGCNVTPHKIDSIVEETRSFQRKFIFGVQAHAAKTDKMSITTRLRQWQLSNYVSHLAARFSDKMEYFALYDLVGCLSRCRGVPAVSRSDLVLMSEDSFSHFCVLIATKFIDRCSFFAGRNFIIMESRCRKILVDVAAKMSFELVLRIQQLFRRFRAIKRARHIRDAVAKIQRLVRKNVWRSIVIKVLKINSASASAGKLSPAARFMQFPRHAREFKSIHSSIAGAHSIAAMIPKVWRNYLLSKNLRLLHEAVASGNCELIQECMEFLPQYLLVKDRHRSMCSIFHIAVEANQVASLEKLNPTQLDLVESDLLGNAPLHYACCFANLSIVKYMESLLQDKAKDVNNLKATSCRHLLYTLQYQKVVHAGWLHKLNSSLKWDKRWVVLMGSRLQYYRVSPAGVDFENPCEEIPLSTQAVLVHRFDDVCGERPHVFVVELLGKNFSTKQRTRMVLRAETKQELLEWTSNLSFFTSTPNAPRMLRRLMSKNITSTISSKVTVRTHCNSHPKTYKNYDITKLWLGSVNNRDETALHCIAGYREDKSNAQLVLAAWLVEHGCSVHSLNVDGESPLQIALDSGNNSMVEFLIQRGADINCLSVDVDLQSYLKRFYIELDYYRPKSVYLKLGAPAKLFGYSYLSLYFEEADVFVNSMK